jgi:hypothetical protein
LLKPRDRLAKGLPPRLSIGRLKFWKFKPAQQRTWGNTNGASRFLNIPLREQCNYRFFLLSSEF